MAVKTNCVKNGVPYFRIHRKINGKYEDFYGKNKSDAEEQYYERKKEAEIGVIQTKDVTTKILLHKWLFSIKTHDLKDSSLESYESTYRNHIKPFEFSDIPIKSISSIVVQDFYNSLFKKERSSETIEDVHKLLRQFYGYCEKEGFIGKNPCNKGLVKIPRDKDMDVDSIIEKQKLPFKYFKDDEIELLRKAFIGNKYENVVDFALGTGMREGEIVGLKWINLNFDNKEIYVKNNTTRVAVFNEEGQKTGYKTKDGTPKTESSIDIIPMSDFIYNLLINLPRTSEYVFTANGHQIDKKDLQKVFKKIIESLMKENDGFVYRVFHDLRHTNGSILASKGVDIVTIANRLGHLPATASAYYLHAVSEEDKKASQKLDNLF